MNYKVEIKIDGVTLYKGNLLDIPLKEDYIIKKSIEIFDDDDPCILHRSFVVKKIVDEIVKSINNANETSIKLSMYKDVVSYIDIPNIEECILSFI